MINKEAKSIIEKNPAAFATCCGNKPNVIGVACIKVISKNQILITDNFMKHTKKNLAKNSNVCLAVWNKSWKGYKLIGKAKYYSKGRWLSFVKKMKENKGLPAKGAIVVKLSKVMKLR